MASPKIPPEVLDYFREQGSKGGRIGGKKRMQSMTAKQRRELALKAVRAKQRKRVKAG